MLFIITAFASATHDIAADGFYMLALKQSDQAAFVGIRARFTGSPLSSGQGVLVAIAGAIELRTENIPLSWTITMLVTAVLFSLVTFYHLFAVPKPASDKSALAADDRHCRSYLQRIRTNIRHLFYQTGRIAGHRIHVAVPPA